MPTRTRAIEASGPCGLPEADPGFGPDCAALEDRILFNAALLGAAVLDALNAPQAGAADASADASVDGVGFVADDAPTDVCDQPASEPVHDSGDCLGDTIPRISTTLTTSLSTASPTTNSKSILCRSTTSRI